METPGAGMPFPYWRVECIYSEAHYPFLLGEAKLRSVITSKDDNVTQELQD